MPNGEESPPEPERSAWTCARCGRVGDWPNMGLADFEQWRHFPGGVLCPDCVTPDDIVAGRNGEIWFDQRTGTHRIACRCGADLGPYPEEKPAEIECLSCHMTWRIPADAVGYGMWGREPPA